jgi:hypothetical protein
VTDGPVDSEIEGASADGQLQDLIVDQPESGYERRRCAVPNLHEYFLTAVSVDIGAADHPPGVLAGKLTVTAEFDLAPAAPTQVDDEAIRRRADPI